MPIPHALRPAFSLVAALLLAAAGFGADAAWAEEPAVGSILRVPPSDLPPPYASAAVANSPRKAPLPETRTLRVPDGFAVNRFAEKLTHARWLAVGPDGAVYLAEPHVKRVLRLRDTNGDGAADERTVFADDLNLPHGLAVQGEHLYIADTRRVWRQRLDRPGTRPEPVTANGALGERGGHWTRNIAFHPDGSRFYVAVGSDANIGVEDPPRATIQEFKADGSGQRTFASGLRNPVGIAFRPGTTDLYAVVNERDGLGDGLVPDYLTKVVEGGFYGWPYAYIGPNPQPGYAEKRPNLVARTIVPDILFRSHSAPLGLTFADGSNFSEPWRSGAFVALHGSWNSADPVGYMVVFVPFTKAGPQDHYVVFATGFRQEGGNKTGEPATVFGRPVGLAIARDGSLLVADDVAHVIWRISRAKS